MPAISPDVALVIALMGSTSRGFKTIPATSFLAKANLIGEGSLTMVLAPITLHTWAMHCPIIPAPSITAVSFSWMRVRVTA